MRPSLSILVLTEDTAKDAAATVTELVRSILLHAEPTTQTHRIEFRPLDPDDEAAMATRADMWKSTKSDDERFIVALARRIATKLREESGFVVFHFDGDRVWSERATSDNVTKFDLFRNRVRQLLSTPKQHRASARGSADRPDAVDPAMQRLLTLVPFWSIEAWLFQNVEVGTRTCQTRKCGRHVSTLSKWKATRSLLDEERKPKTLLCFGSTYNLELARRGFPLSEVVEVRKSLAATVEHFQSCAALRAALRATAQESP